MPLIVHAGPTQQLVNSCRTAREDGRAVLVAFVAEDCFPEDGNLKGRLTHIKWIRIDGHLVYKHLPNDVSKQRTEDPAYMGLYELTLVEATFCAALDEGELNEEDVKVAFQRSLDRVLTRQPQLSGVLKELRKAP